MHPPSLHRKDAIARAAIATAKAIFEIADWFFTLFANDFQFTNYALSFSKSLMSSLLIRYCLPIFLAWSLRLRIQSHTVIVLTWYLSAIWAQVYNSGIMSPSFFVYCYTCVYFGLVIYFDYRLKFIAIRSTTGNVFFATYLVVCLYYTTVFVTSQDVCYEFRCIFIGL